MSKDSSAMQATRTRVLVLLAALGLGGCCDEQWRTYVLNSPDQDLSAMFAACQSAGNDACTRTSTAGCPPACIEFCKRVMTIAGDNPGELKVCVPGTSFYSLGGTTTTLRVVVAWCS